MKSPAAVRLVGHTSMTLVAVFLASFLIFAVQPAAGTIFQEMEDFSTDPMWDAFQNMTDTQNFGWSAGTNNAGGALGELGGAVIRTPQAYYAANIGSIDPSTTTLLASGTAAFNATSGNVLVGWFDRGSNMAWGPPEDFIGFRTDDNKYIRVNFAGSDTTVQNSMGESLDNVSSGITLLAPFDYELSYVPTGGADNGGVFTATFSNVIIEGRTDNTYSVTIEPSESTRDGISNLTRHGLHNLFIDGNDSGTEFWLDDMEFTSDDPIISNDFTWVAGGAGNWHTISNWTLFTVPNNNQQTAILGNSISGPATVFAEQNITVKGLQFDSANSYGIAGTAGVSLTMEANTGNASIQVDQGSHEFQLPVNLASDLDVNVASDATLAFDSALNIGIRTLTKTGPGTMLINNAERSGSGGVFVQEGTLGGGGGIGGDLSNTGGTVAPGESVGTLNVDGGFTQADGGTLAIELGGTADGTFDVLDVAGAATLDGLLDVQLIDSFEPTSGETFDVLLASNITDNGLDVSSGFRFDIITNSILRLTFTGSGVDFEADFDRDGDVDGDDFLLWQVGFGAGITSGATKMDGDYDNDGDVDGDDFLGWQVEFPSPGDGSGSNAVPEPSALVLLCIALVGALGWFRTGGHRMYSAFGRITPSVGFVFLAAGAIFLTAAPPAQADLKIENFDVDPGWDAVNNVDAGFAYEFMYWDFLNFAGGNVGEIGGIMPTLPAPAPAYYADNIGTLDPSTAVLSMSGKGNYRSGNGQIFFGWFDKDGELTHVNADDSRNFVQFMGITTDDDRFKLFAGDNVVELAPRPGTTPFTFSLTFDPNANGGFGALMGSINGGAVGVLNLGEGVKDSYNDFDRFGLLADENLALSLPTGRFSEWYFDDLIYTTSVPQPPILRVEWVNDASGNLASNGSWDPGLAPNSNEVTAVLGSAITASRTVYADTDLLMKTLEIDNANAYIVAGQGVLNLEADTGNASIDVLQGSHELRIEAALGSDLDVTVPLGETLTFDNLLDLNGFTLTKLGAGDMVINNTLILDSGMISVSGGNVINNTAVPEPSTTVLAGMLILACAAFRKRDIMGGRGSRRA